MERNKIIKNVVDHLELLGDHDNGDFHVEHTVNGGRFVLACARPHPSTRRSGVHTLETAPSTLAAKTMLSDPSREAKTTAVQTYLHVRFGLPGGGLPQAIFRLRQNKHASVRGFFGGSSMSGGLREGAGGATLTIDDECASVRRAEACVRA